MTRAAYLAAMAAAASVAHHLLVLAARAVEAWAGTRRMTPERQAAAITVIRL